MSYFGVDRLEALKTNWALILRLKRPAQPEGNIMICPDCKQGTLDPVKACEPYTTDHYQCDHCDGTYTELPMTYKEQIEALLIEMEAREKAATPGPWKSDFCGDVWTISPDVPLDESEPMLGPIFRGIGSTTTGPDSGNGLFIAHARTDMPALIAALRVAIEQLQGTHQDDVSDVLAALTSGEGEK